MNRQHISTAELVGRLGQAPELEYTADRAPYAQLSVATSEGTSPTSRGDDPREDRMAPRRRLGRARRADRQGLREGRAPSRSPGRCASTASRRTVLKHRTDRCCTSSPPTEAPDKPVPRTRSRLVGVVREDAAAEDSSTAAR